MDGKREKKNKVQNDRRNMVKKFDTASVGGSKSVQTFIKGAFAKKIPKYMINQIRNTNTLSDKEKNALIDGSNKKRNDEHVHVTVPDAKYMTRTLKMDDAQLMPEQHTDMKNLPMDDEEKGFNEKNEKQGDDIRPMVFSSTGHNIDYRDFDPNDGPEFGQEFVMVKYNNAVFAVPLDVMFRNIEEFRENFVDNMEDDDETGAFFRTNGIFLLNAGLGIKEDAVDITDGSIESHSDVKQEQRFNYKMTGEYGDDTRGIQEAFKDHIRTDGLNSSGLSAPGPGTQPTPSSGSSFQFPTPGFGTPAQSSSGKTNNGPPSVVGSDSQPNSGSEQPSNPDYPIAPAAMPGTGVGSQPFTTMTQFVQKQPGDLRGDVLSTNPTNTDNVIETMRNTRYGEAGPNDVISSERDQLQSDITFDMFSEVSPGFGHGSTNKLFLQQINRDKKIIGMKPLTDPTQYLGPLGTITPPAWQLQPVMDKNVINSYIEEANTKRDRIATMVEMNDVKSTNVLGDDVGYPFGTSSSGLKRGRTGVFRPIIDNHIGWQHIKSPTGLRLNQSIFRRDFDAKRYPRHLRSTIAMEGGGTINVDRAYKKLGFF
jgi:hypothetical protein